MPEQRNQTQAKLVATTAALLRERGYHGSGLTEILGASGVPKGSLYHHFPAGKAELAAESIKQSGQRIATRLARLVDEHGGVAPAIVAFCDGYIEELQSSEFRRGCPLATVALESGDLPATVRTQIGVAMRAMVDLLADRITEQWPHAADPTGIATEIVAAVEGALMLAKATRSTAPIEVVRDRVVARLATEPSAVSPQETS